MTIALCGSLSFSKEILVLREALEAKGFVVRIPLSIEKMLRGEVTHESIESMKKDGTFSSYVVENDAIEKYYKVIEGSDAILVANYTKNGIENYIGGNSFLEMGFAYVLHKKIYVLHDLPHMPYLSEIESMRPVVLKGSLEGIR